ncbi:hypothetical protein EZS27_010113 [termite gut metagenome]|uniref:Uncharacterized protein n=1 Tax=termite gut metagenome TaxID=433724 RepID=A0A5J4S8F2_9ZZZZ
MGKFKKLLKPDNLTGGKNSTENNLPPVNTDESKPVVFKTVTKEEHDRLKIPIYREVYKDLYIP